MLIPSLWWLPCGFSYFPFSHVYQLGKMLLLYLIKDTLSNSWLTQKNKITYLSLCRKKNNHLTNGICHFLSVWRGREWIHATFMCCMIPGHLASWPWKTFLSWSFAPQRNDCHFLVHILGVTMALVPLPVVLSLCIHPSSRSVGFNSGCPELGA